LPSISLTEIIIILVVVLAVVFLARLRKRPKPAPKTDQSSPVTGDTATPGSARRWIITVAMLVLAGLLAYYVYLTYGQP
jgi:heme/copper-type cytochrome/quinol oxidase subunit 2